MYEKYELVDELPIIGTNLSDFGVNLKFVAIYRISVKEIFN